MLAAAAPDLRTDGLSVSALGAKLIKSSRAGVKYITNDRRTTRGHLLGGWTTGGAWSATAELTRWTAPHIGQLVTRDKSLVVDSYRYTMFL